MHDGVHRFSLTNFQMQLPTRDSVDRDFVISLRDKDSDCGNKGTLFLAARCRRDFDVWVRAFGALASRQPQQVSETDVITDDVQVESINRRLMNL
mmetsp:Transcript_53081/g.140026  ORF Transcript_53081/g.140026 Transcript_53081/m.140026 type:complete len:95 (-) Transcript_53081:735-1019(-)